MKWEKLGLIYAPSGEQWWAKDYAHLPTALLLNDSVIRVFFTSLDQNKYGRIGFVDVDAENPSLILNVSKEPVFDIGEIGSFDDCGVVPSCIIEKNSEIWCYYHGFQRTERVPYLIFTGLALIDRETGSFQRFAKTPILDRTNSEPFLRGAPSILYEDGIFRMWYVSCVRWVMSNDKLHYINVIRHASSSDGISWEANDHICLEPDLPDEYSVGRPCVVRNEHGYEMWFSARSHGKLYEVGHAFSVDGIHWIRNDCEAGIEKSQSGWDAEMICYPSIIKTSKCLYMFYNGNKYGASGFGCAKVNLPA